MFPMSSAMADALPVYECGAVVVPTSCDLGAMEITRARGGRSGLGIAKHASLLMDGDQTA